MERPLNINEKIWKNSWILFVPHTTIFSLTILKNVNLIFWWDTLMCSVCIVSKSNCVQLNCAQKNSVQSNGAPKNCVQSNGAQLNVSNSTVCNCNVSNCTVRQWASTICTYILHVMWHVRASYFCENALVDFFYI